MILLTTELTDFLMCLRLGKSLFSSVKIFLCYWKDKVSVKIDFKIKCNLETEIKTLFESKKKLTAIAASDPKIIFTKAPFSQYEQFKLNKKFLQYVKTIMISSKILRIGDSERTFTKNILMSIGSQNFNIGFFGANRQYDLMKISLGFDKSNKYITIYDSYSV